MDAPLYPPASAFEAPVPVAYAMTTAAASISQLLADPAIAAILRQEISGFDAQADRSPAAGSDRRARPPASGSRSQNGAREYPQNRKTP